MYIGALSHLDALHPVWTTQLFAYLTPPPIFSAASCLLSCLCFQGRSDQLRGSSELRKDVLVRIVLIKSKIHED